MRSAEFAFQAPEGGVSKGRHRARSLNFDDQSVFSYSSPNKSWWGYA